MLKISFLGKLRFEGQRGDITDKIGTKAAALIALLILRENKSMSREKAISYLWPDSNEDAEKYNLRYTFWTLKKLFGEDDQNQHFFHIDKEYCGINLGYNFQCDILELLRFNIKKEHDIQRLLEMKSLFRGDFFEGHYFNNCDEFNELILFERNNFENKKIKIFEKLAQAYEDQKKYEECMNILNEIFKLDPYSEKTALKALNIYFLKNDRSGGVKFYKNFSNRLIKDLGIRPSSELVSRYNDIKMENKDIALSSRNSSMNRLTIRSYCMKNIDFFWITDVIEGIIEDKSFNPSAFEEYILRDISFILPHIWEEHIKYDDISPVPPVRIVKACINFIIKASKDHCLDITIENFEDMDKTSGAIYEYICKLNLENITYSRF